ncbi:hypothetical protein HMPREF9278_1251 [Mobiluncus mulieris FB024-16]|nr:hypothetical protein HMPREF9278_1251 [Mobiluncus mulieris FB024-16]
MLGHLSSLVTGVLENANGFYLQFYNRKFSDFSHQNLGL